jgi:hypothetical protein
LEAEREVMDQPSGIVRGGRNFYGVPLGIVMMDTPIPRLPGDVGNATTWPFPVHFRVVRGAGVRRVIHKLPTRELLEPFIEAAQELDRAGVSVITTSGGYLALFQRELQASVRAMMLSSSLLQVPWVASLLPAGRRVGILTMEARSLTPEHLAAVGVTPDMLAGVVGMEEVAGYTHDVYLNAHSEFEPARIQAELEDAARLLMSRHPEVGAIVCECTNFPPFAHAIQAAAGVPVYDLVTLVTWMVQAHQRRPFVSR